MGALHPYQASVVNKIQGHIRRGAKSILLVAPTGSGKTRMVSEAMRKSEKTCLAIAHRVELCKQIDAEFSRTGPSGYEVLGIGARRVGDVVKSGAYKALFVDEGHHLAAASYRRLIENRGDMILVAATATPYRADGASIHQFFDKVVMAPTAHQLSATGYLATLSYVSSDKVDYAGIKLTKQKEFEKQDALRRVRVSVQAGDLVSAWAKYARGKNALIYGINLEHCDQIQSELRAARVPCAIVSSRTSSGDRARLAADFENRKLRALINCEVFTEGTDLKNVGAIIMLRPTRSRALYKQMIGRGMRPDVSCVVIDHVGNFLRHGNVMTEDPISVMNSARLGHASIGGSSNMTIEYERMDLHIETVQSALEHIWVPSVFRVVKQ